jgi:hypothetical protein
MKLKKIALNGLAMTRDLPEIMGCAEATNNTSSRRMACGSFRAISYPATTDELQSRPYFPRLREITEGSSIRTECRGCFAQQAEALVRDGRSF